MRGVASSGLRRSRILQFIALAWLVSVESGSEARNEGKVQVTGPEAPPPSVSAVIARPVNIRSPDNRDGYFRRCSTTN